MPLWKINPDAVPYKFDIEFTTVCPHCATVWTFDFIKTAPGAVLYSGAKWIASPFEMCSQCKSVDVELPFIRWNVEDLK